MKMYDRSEFEKLLLEDSFIINFFFSHLLSKKVRTAAAKYMCQASKKKISLIAWRWCLVYFSIRWLLWIYPQEIGVTPCHTKVSAARALPQNKVRIVDNFFSLLMKVYADGEIFREKKIGKSLFSIVCTLWNFFKSWRGFFPSAVFSIFLRVID